MYSTAQGRIEVDGGVLLVDREGANVIMTIHDSRGEGFPKEVAVFKFGDCEELIQFAEAIKKMAEVI